MEGCKEWKLVKPLKRTIYGPGNSLSFIEQVLTTVTFSYQKRGDTEISLYSPITTSILSSKRGDSHRGSITWTFKSLRHFGEEYNIGDLWNVTIIGGTIQQVKIEFLGY